MGKVLAEYHPLRQGYEVKTINGDSFLAGALPYLQARGFALLVCVPLDPQYVDVVEGIIVTKSKAKSKGYVVMLSSCCVFLVVR
jgi:hypothetical protein